MTPALPSAVPTAAAADAAAVLPDDADQLTPRQIVAALDTYIVGQRDAKKSVAIALRNRWRRLHAPPEMRDEIMPNNIIMIGPTGVGKTEIARRLAKLVRAPFIKVEATKFTEVGYVGRDVESMVRDLADLAVNMVKEEQAERVQDKAAERAEERILDLLIPPSQPARPAAMPGMGFSPASTPDKEPDPDPMRERTRERFRQMLRDGELDDREVEVEVSASSSNTLKMFGPMGMEEMGINLQDMFGGGGKRKKRRLPIREARELIRDEEAEKLIDHEGAVQEAIERLEQNGIIFIDEIDKVAGRSENRSGPDVSREGVQRDLLPIVEGSAVTTKHGLVRTDHVLFVASGAFHVSKPSDLIPELQGRFPIRVELQNLTEDDFFRILTEPKNALLKQYAALFQSEGVALTFTDDAVRAVAKTAARVNEEVENIGARRLHTVLTTLLEDVLFEMPESGQEAVEVTAETVQKRLGHLVEDRDLSQYIL